MSRRRDGLEIMRANNPVDPSQLPGPDSLQVQEMLARVMATPRLDTPIVEQAPKAPSIPAWRRRPVLAYSIIALLATAGVWYWLANVSNPQAITCYEQVSLTSNRAIAPRGGPATAEACAPLWEQGTLTNPTFPQGSVPPLVACVSPAGGLAVFPTEDENTCTQLGLARPDPGGQDQADAIRELEEDLARFFISQECLTMEDAKTQVRQILDDAGFTGWQIFVHPEHPDRPCASFGFEPQAETVHLIPDVP